MPPRITRWPIRKKLTLGALLLMIAVCILAFGGFSNAYSFRGLVRSISQRASELPDAIALVQHVSALRATLPPPSDSHQLLQGGVDSSPIGWPMVSFEFERRLNDVEVSLSLYRERINESIEIDGPIGAPRRELKTVQEMES
ncbi:MAG: hypothetical protein KDB23_04920, partial [Planctomycetales bacterium]|nr:hypothetical protein [Planctomycetales bacterium]